MKKTLNKIEPCSGRAFSPAEFFMGDIQTEEYEQRQVVMHLEMRELKFTAIPNSTFTKSWKTRMKNKRDGLRPGLLDLLIVLPKKLLFIEMKKTEGGVVSAPQKGWIEALNNIDGKVVVEAVVCKGAEEAIKKIDDELGLK